MPTVTEIILLILVHLIGVFAGATIGFVVLVRGDLLISSIKVLLSSILNIVGGRNFFSNIQIIWLLKIEILRVLLVATCIFLFIYLVLTSSFVSSLIPTSDENNNSYRRPTFPPRGTEERESNQHYSHRLVHQVQHDVNTFLLLLCMLNVIIMFDTLQQMMGDIEEAIFATEEAARATILERLLRRAHSLDGSEQIEQRIMLLMTKYPVGMLQRENITLQMYTEMHE